MPLIFEGGILQTCLNCGTEIKQALNILIYQGSRSDLVLQFGLPGEQCVMATVHFFGLNPKTIRDDPTRPEQIQQLVETKGSRQAYTAQDALHFGCTFPKGVGTP